MANIMLTRKQKEIAILIAKGLSNEEIADELYITPGTVKNHVSAVYEGLGLKRAPEYVRRVRVMIYVLVEGWLSWYDWAEDVSKYTLTEEKSEKE